jgi:hypothetical protein
MSKDSAEGGLPSQAGPRRAKAAPGGALEPEDLPGPPGICFICPSNHRQSAWDDDLDLAARSVPGKVAGTVLPVALSLVT